VIGRRRWLAALAAPWLQAAAAESAESSPEADPVRRGRPLVFPRDHGAHLSARTEWWYATGWLGRPEAPSHGFQVTFFRSRTGLAAGLPGRLAPRQLLFAHAAVTDLAAGSHRHAQRIVRWNGEASPIEPPRAAGAATDDAHVWIGDWQLRREGERWRSSLRQTEQREPWALAIDLRRTQPLLLQGDAGFSRKGPQERQASHYYSEPQLAAEVMLTLGGRQLQASGRAWLDHEWSEEILAADAVGWDWIGFNLFDGSALTAFQLRRRDGSALWAGGSHRASGATAATDFGPQALRWTAGRRWRSPVTGADYPLDWVLATPAGPFTVRALLDAQELDSRQGTGTVYWEGLSELLDADGRRIGLGYLEMTGYAGTLRL
jgi:predicted secreted hydrolase